MIGHLLLLVLSKRMKIRGGGGLVVVSLTFFSRSIALAMRICQ